MVAIEYQGSLEAEHGTGRNIAPFVELEWGSEAYTLMKKIKNLFDPEAILSPGVILNSDPNVHLKNLKRLPIAHPLIDKCTECGFCEPVCPSRNLSLTSWQRIALYREIQRRKAESELPEDLEPLEDAFSYLGVDTCAATGLCEDRCPVGINTGDLVKTLRGEQNRYSHKPVALIARHFEGVTFMVRGGLIAANASHRALGTAGMNSASSRLRKASGNRIPLWSPATPRGGSPKTLNRYRCKVVGEEIIYWPSCASRNFALPSGSSKPTLTSVALRLLEKAGYQVTVMSNNGLCCGQPFFSKGHPLTGAEKQRELEDELKALSRDGEVLVVGDTSPCAMQMNLSSIDVLDPVKFAIEHLMSRLKVAPVPGSIALHITCSTRKMGLARQAEHVARQCSESVIIPTNIECCGFAGDKGFNIPELNASALSTLKSQVKGCRQGYSTSLTCEIGLAAHSEIPYSSILYLIDEAAQ